MLGIHSRTRIGGVASRRAANRLLEWDWLSLKSVMLVSLALPTLVAAAMHRAVG